MQGNSLVILALLLPVLQPVTEMILHRNIHKSPITNSSASHTFWGIFVHIGWSAGTRNELFMEKKGRNIQLQEQSREGKSDDEL
jgi:hypothetical protein